MQVARAVEIDHVKVLGYRRREADLLRTRQRGSGGTEAVRTRLMNVSRASFGKVQSVSGALKSCQ